MHVIANQPEAETDGFSTSQDQGAAEPQIAAKAKENLATKSRAAQPLTELTKAEPINTRKELAKLAWAAERPIAITVETAADELDASPGRFSAELAIGIPALPGMPVSAIEGGQHLSPGERGETSPEGLQELPSTVLHQAGAGAAGIEPVTDQAESLNLHRRHLTGGQLAMCAGRADELRAAFAEKAKERHRANGGDKVSDRAKAAKEHVPAPLPNAQSRDQVGKIFGVSGRAVDHAAKVLADAIPEVVAAAEYESIDQADAEDEDNQKPRYLPKPAMIRRLCLEIQSGWSEHERYTRAAYAGGEPPPRMATMTARLIGAPIE